MSDAARRKQWCEGGDDEDMVPNALDQCLQTRPLRQTDDVGCEVFTLPVAPPRAAVDAVMGTWGAVFDPRCQGAVDPTTPAGFLHRLYFRPSPTAGTIIFGFGDYKHDDSARRPASWSIRIQAVLTTVSGQRKFMTTTFSSMEAQRELDNIKLVASSTDGRPDRALISNDLTAINYRVRVMNGNGQTSAWSRWSDE